MGGVVIDSGVGMLSVDDCEKMNETQLFIVQSCSKRASAVHITTEGKRTTMCNRSEVFGRGRCLLSVLILTMPLVLGGAAGPITPPTKNRCRRSVRFWTKSKFWSSDRKLLLVNSRSRNRRQGLRPRRRYRRSVRFWTKSKLWSSNRKLPFVNLRSKNRRQGLAFQEVEKKLAGLEGVVGDESRWPKSIDDAKRVRDELQALLKQVPPSSDDALAPRIIPLRWNVEVLGILATTEKPQDADWDSISTTCRSFLQAAPDNRSQALFDRLKERSKYAIAKAADYRRVAAIKAAKDTLTDNNRDPCSRGQTLKHTNRACRARTLPICEVNYGLRYLTGKLKSNSRRFARTFDRAKAGGNDRRVQGAIARVYDAATSIFLDLDIESPRREAAIKNVLALLELCDNELKAINQRQQAEADGRVRAYQAWCSNRSRPSRLSRAGSTPRCWQLSDNFFNLASQPARIWTWTS